MKHNRLATGLTAALAVIIIGLTGCGQARQSDDSATGTPPSLPTPETPASDLLAQIQAKGELVIATEGTWAPWTYHDESNQLVGFDVEIARLIAEKLGVKATFVEGEWDGLLAGISSGRYDIMANGVEVTNERAETYDFSEPYAYIRTAIITSGDNTEISSFEDLSGKQTANTLASTYATLAERYGATAVGVDDLNQTIELLLTRRVDATLNAEVTYYDYMKAHPDANLKIAALTEEASRVSFPVRKGADSQSLLAAVNEALDELSEAGELRRISMKYFNSDLSSLQTEDTPTDPDTASKRQTAVSSEVETPAESTLPEDMPAESTPAQIALQAPEVTQTSIQSPANNNTAITIEAGGKSFAGTLYDNPSAQEFAAMLPLTLDMHDVNANEKAYFFSDSLPTDSTRPGQIHSGDLMLYGSDCLVLFYDSFSSSYSYTPLGSLEDASGLAAALGTGDLQVVFRISNG